MRKWMVRDRRGREIHITEERWRHILELHDELAGLFDDILDTIRKGEGDKSHMTLRPTNITDAVSACPRLTRISSLRLSSASMSYWMVRRSPITSSLPHGECTYTRRGRKDERVTFNQV